MKLIRPDTINFRATITEDELRERIGQEVLESIGALTPAGAAKPGVTVKVLRGDGRKGGYTIDVTGPAPATLSLPSPTPETPQ